MRAKPPVCDVDKRIDREPDTMREEGVGMPEMALGTDRDFVCFVVLMGCLVAVGAVTWLYGSPEDTEAYGQSGGEDESLGQISDTPLVEVMGVDAMLVYNECSKWPLASIREESEDGNNPSRDGSPHLRSNKKED
tara:strand:- start:1787 stop:2191 length:405 start_codon:yes stop_codon:yes gene_type:complete